MKILSIDSSHHRFSLAVSEGDQVIASKNVRLKKLLTNSIMPSIDKVLEKNKIALEQIDGFAIGLGPGAFTSLRVGFSTIKGIVFAAKKPVVGISSLDVLAMASPKKEKQICVLCDAKRSLAYCCFYKWDDDDLVRTAEYELLPIKDVLKRVDEPTFFIGDGIKVFEDDLKKFRKVKISLAPESKWYPQAKFLAALALKRFETKQVDDINKLLPLYLYPEDCQVNKKGQ